MANYNGLFNLYAFDELSPEAKKRALSCIYAHSAFVCDRKLIKIPSTKDPYLASCIRSFVEKEKPLFDRDGVLVM